MKNGVVEISLERKSGGKAESLCIERHIFNRCVSGHMVWHATGGTRGFCYVLLSRAVKDKAGGAIPKTGSRVCIRV